MQFKYIVLLLLCLVAGLSITPCHVLASSHGGGGGSHEIEDPDDSGHGGGGGQHGTVSDDKIVNNLVGSFKVIWNWCCTTKVFVGSYSFTFAQFFLFEILAGIVIWFIWYLMYYG